MGQEQRSRGHGSGGLRDTLSDSRHGAYEVISSLNSPAETADQDYAIVRCLWYQKQ